ncbi:MAG: Mor transcription activator family protein [Ghiorsea sp.]|nr:Mor transcription activator family protein [Ghiorsea sp.]
MSKAYQQAPLFDAMEADVADIINHMDDDSVADEKRAWPSTLAEAIDVLTADAKERGLDDKQALKEARRTILLLSNYWGGRMLYLPRNEKLRLALRDNQIWLEFKGDNVQALADKHKLTSTMIYIILKAQRRLTLSRKQKNLFPNEAPK